LPFGPFASGIGHANHGRRKRCEGQVRRFDAPRCPKIIGLVLVTAALAACGVVDALVDGFKHVKAVEADLEQITGVRPAVSFNWNNGRLTSVTVTFPKLYTDKPLPDLAEATQAAVGKEFKQPADDVVLAFSLGAATTAAH